ncbi:MAG TPA: hypothetical protein PLO94_10315 [Chitinophagales bacterium]|nr:hypothetical protein [Chitinophagales bacterium]
MDTIVEAIINFIKANEGVELVLIVMGSLVTIASVIDSMIPDDIDKGFFKKINDMFIIGSIIRVVSRFSILRNQKGSIIDDNELNKK